MAGKKKDQKSEVDYAQEALFREVHEDVEHERLVQFWKKYGAGIISIAVVAILAVTAWQGHAWYRARQVEQDAVIYTQAVNDILYNPAQAFSALEQLKETNRSGFAVLARFQSASQKMDMGQTPAALQELREISEDKTVKGPFRGLATVVLCYHLLDADDAGDEIETRLAPLSADDSMWRGSAREILAVSAHKAGDRFKALELLNLNRDDDALPDGFSRRAAEMLAAIN